MMEFALLAKVIFGFKIVEKVAYGIWAIYMGKAGIKYIKDYKESVESENFKVKRKA